MYSAILRLHDEQLLTLNPLHRRPLNLARPQDVLHTQVEHTRTKPLNLARQMVAILHNNHVGALPSKQRCSKKKDTAQDDGPHLRK